MDGLPGMQRALVAGKKEKVEPIKKMVGPFAPKRYNYALGVPVAHVALIAFLSFLMGVLFALNSERLLEVARNLDMSAVRSAITVVPVAKHFVK